MVVASNVFIGPLVSRCAGAYLNGSSHVSTVALRCRRRAIKEYERLGPERFFSEHGFGPSRSYELVWEERRYPHKAILGTAYEFATGRRLGSADFEGGKSGAVAVLGELGFTVEDKR